MRKGSVDGIGYHRVAISEACWTNCLLDIACWTLPPSRSLCLLPSAQVLKEDVLSEMPQCCCDACIKAHDRAAGVRSGKSLGSLGYGLGSAPPCTPVSSHLAHLASVEMGGKVFGTLGTVWVRGEYSALLMLLALVAAFTGKPSHLVSTAGDHQRHPRHRHR